MLILCALKKSKYLFKNITYEFSYATKFKKTYQERYRNNWSHKIKEKYDRMSYKEKDLVKAKWRINSKKR